MTLCEHEEMEVLPKDVENFCKDKRLRKMMDLLLKEEKDKYFLQLAQEGVRLPSHFDAKDIIAPKEETENSEMEKQLKIIQDQIAHLQQLKEEEERSSNKFSFRDYFPSYDVESKTSQNNLQTPKESKPIFEEKPLEPKPKRAFTSSCESTLEECLKRKLIVLPKVTFAGSPFLSYYCAYHRHNLHTTSHCRELKNKIQDLVDAGII